MPIGTYTCDNCGVLFTAKRNPHRDSKFYCSPDCQNKARQKRVDVTCEECGKVFSVHPTRFRQAGGAKFCSRECKSKNGHKDLVCIQCGKTVSVRRHVVDSGKYSGNFCSYDCAAAWQKGTNHSNWQGGHEKWRGPTWKKQKDAARKRDGYKCQNCGATETEIGRTMDVHHVKPWREFDGDWERANALTNLVSLCPRCHTTIERGGVSHHIRTSP